MSQFDFKILRKPGYMLNPEDKVVNGILKALFRNGGHCPCHHPEREGHDQCPCSEWIHNNRCFCGLYIKVDEKLNSNN